MRLVVALPNRSVPNGEPHLHDTGLAGFVWNDCFVVGFADDVVAEEIARIVAAAIRREHGARVPIRVEDES